MHKISKPEQQIMPCEVLPQFPQHVHVLLLLCNDCINMTSERHQGDGVMASYNYQTLSNIPNTIFAPSLFSLYNFSID